MVLDKQGWWLSSLSVALRSYFGWHLEWLPKNGKTEPLSALENLKPTATCMVPGPWGEREIWRGGAGHAIPQNPSWLSILTAESALPIPAQAPNKADETNSWNPQRPVHPGFLQLVGNCTGILELLVELLGAWHQHQWGTSFWHSQDRQMLHRLELPSSCLLGATSTRLLSLPGCWPARWHLNLAWSTV